MALTSTDKRQVKKIARKVANKVFDKRFQQEGGGDANCPANTDRYGEGCIEEDARNNAQWTAAADDCGDDNRRLPTLAELEGFRTQTGVTLEDKEWTSDVDDVGGLLEAHRLNDGGQWDTLDTTSLSQYRCVAPLT